MSTVNIFNNANLPKGVILIEDDMTRDDNQNIEVLFEDYEFVVVVVCWKQSCVSAYNNTHTHIANVRPMCLGSPPSWCWSESILPIHEMSLLIVGTFKHQISWQKKTFS